jgi:hypothetical protein
MTFADKVAVVWVVGGIFLIVIPQFLPNARVGGITLYDAGMFAVCLVVLAWGVLTIVDGKHAMGWLLIIAAAGLFGWRMYWLFRQYERKMRGPGDSESGQP